MTEVLDKPQLRSSGNATGLILSIMDPAARKIQKIVAKSWPKDRKNGEI